MVLRRSASAGNLTSSQDQSLTLSCGIPEYFTKSLKNSCALSSADTYFRDAINVAYFENLSMTTVPKSPTFGRPVMKWRDTLYHAFLIVGAAAHAEILMPSAERNDFRLLYLKMRIEKVLSGSEIAPLRRASEGSELSRGLVARFQVGSCPALKDPRGGKKQGPIGQLSKARIALFELVEMDPYPYKAEKLHPIVKPWPFRVWAVDLIEDSGDFQCLRGPNPLLETMKEALRHRQR
ncbi:unnamed protein product [Dovyalis caffra]|uniref:Uncharacterized protein n=1 Tax=Dovyalis caffra TaxID=77055 RepID=A0AAV1R3K7_9ROSI|nr:unnamed protein product [Dovyalis caffra]